MRRTPSEKSDGDFVCAKGAIEYDWGMDDDEKRQILAKHMAKFRTWSYGEITARIGMAAHLETVEWTATDGTPCFMDFDVFWDDEPHGNVRVAGYFWGDKRVLGFLPIYMPDASDAFLMQPDGSLVGEDDASFVKAAPATPDIDRDDAQ